MKKHYFNNDVMQPIIVDYFKRDEAWQISEEGKKIGDQISREILKIIRGIIMTHRFYKWDSVDNLTSDAFEACWNALSRFDPAFITKSGKAATVFNYLSLTAKKSCLYQTIANKKNRETFDIDEQFNVCSKEDFVAEIETDMIMESVSDFLFKKVNEKYSSDSPVRLKVREELKEIIPKFLRAYYDLKMKKTYQKGCLTITLPKISRHLTQFGVSQPHIRRLTLIIKNNEKEFRKLIC